MKRPSAPRPDPREAKREPPNPEPSKPLTEAERRRMAMRPPSFTELLPWTRFDPDQKVFLLKDVQTLGAMFELAPVPTEAQTADFLADRAHKVREALQAIDESDTSPWIVQFFLNDDANIENLKGELARYIEEVHKKEPKRAQEILESRYTQAYIAEMAAHLDNVSRPQGYFTDTTVTGQIWRGQIRRVRCFIYKRFSDLVEDRSSAFAQIEQVAITLMATLNEAGVGTRRCTGRDLYDWMLPFFNRKVPWAKSPGDLLRQAPYPGDRAPEGAAPIYDWDFAESLNLSQPKSDVDAGLFEFDGVPVKVMTLQNLKAQPSIGHFTAERKSGHEFFARFDRLPVHSMLSMTVVIQPQDAVERHVTRIRDASRARTPIAQETFAECERVLQQMARGDKLFPMFMTLYLSGATREELNASISAANAQLVPSGLRFVEPRHDLAPLDAFIRGLPMAYEPVFDMREMRRSRLVFASHVAALAPLYGRARGTGRPGMWVWNRGGEPILFDPLSEKDRKKNAHLLMFGPTGAGKSATGNSLCRSVMAIYRPRLVIADAGGSFALNVQEFKELGLSTHVVKLTADGDVSLPPFVMASQLLDDPDIMSSFRAGERSPEASDTVMDKLAADPTLIDEEELAERVIDPDTDGADEDGGEAQKRDVLGEMMIAAIMMITGGEAKEIERLTRADRYLVSLAIIRAAVKAKDAGKPHPLTHDVAIAFMDMVHDESMSPARRARAEEMGQSMMVFTQGLRGRLFNRYGRDWPDVDVTLVEMGMLTSDEYVDALAVAFSSLVDSVHMRGERAQAEDRPLVFLTDEAHLITTNELLGPKIAKASKMWRKLSIWLWLLTQNLKDFPASMSRVLSMCEWWFLLTMDKSELEEIARFRTLTAEQRQLIESARKEPGKYTEGVVISANSQVLFRNVPPPMSIALGMTEGHEKAT
ncbi:MAG: conjugative transfer ATPase, partial [Burkholderiales bacterium]|nr:conjugative transfer ATPase [Burkholderiales bacterium]